MNGIEREGNNAHSRKHSRAYDTPYFPNRILSLEIVNCFWKGIKIIPDWNIFLQNDFTMVHINNMKSYRGCNRIDKKRIHRVMFRDTKMLPGYVEFPRFLILRDLQWFWLLEESDSILVSRGASFLSKLWRYFEQVH